MRVGSSSRVYVVSEGQERPTGCCARMSANVSRFKAFLSKHFCDFCATIPTILLIILAIIMFLLVLSVIPIAIFATMKNGSSSVEVPDLDLKHASLISHHDAWPLEEGGRQTYEMTKTRLLVPPNVTACIGHGFSCVGTPSIVIGANQRCDGKNDCPDGSDEADCQSCMTSFSCLAKQGSNRRLCLRGDSICDGTQQCADGLDESFCHRECDFGEYKCHNFDVCIPLAFLCDGDEHCPLGDDELNCDKCNNGARYCAETKTCIPIWDVCNGIADCPDKSDELNCDCKTCSGSQTALCKSNSTNMCILKKHVCDGVSDCPNGEDEETCAGSCSDVADVIPHHADILCDDGSHFPWKYACSGLYPQCVSACKECNLELAFQCDNNTKCIHRSKICDGRSDCQDGSDEHNCTQRYLNCDEESKRCDSFKDCDDGRDELNCHECKPPSFHCVGEGRCIPSHQRCDGIEQCANGSDEENCSCNECSLHPFPLYSCELGNRCFRMEDVCAPHTRCPDPTRRDKMFCATREQEYF